MKQSIFMRRWIILVLLLMISITFLFLQLLSLKVIDNTVISRFRVLESLRGLLPFQHQRNLVLKHLKTFTEVTKQHGIPTFLFYPLPASFPVKNSSKFQNLENDRCELLCDCQYFVFGVIRSAWQKGEKIPISSLIPQLISHLSKQGFTTVCHNVEEPWFDSSKDFMNINIIISSCTISQFGITVELLVFYDRDSYLWHGPLQGYNALTIADKDSGAFNRFSIKEAIVDGIRLNLPSDPDKLASQQKQSRFKGCNLTNARHYYSKYGRDVSPDAVLFKSKALEVLSIAIKSLNRLGVRYWLSSGTCLGWFRQCDIIPHSKDVDIGIWIKDYNPLLISEFKKSGLLLKHKFGRIEDSFELSFRTVEDYVKLDIFFFYEEKDYMWNGGTQARTGKKFKYIFPIFTLCWTELFGLKARVPCETEAYVLANYGKDWHIPIKEWNWKESPPNVRENGQWDEKDWGEVIQLY